MAKISFEDKSYEVEDNVAELFSTLKTKLIDSEKRVQEIEMQTKKTFLIDKAVSLGVDIPLEDKSIDYIEGFIAGIETNPNKPANSNRVNNYSYDNIVIEL